MAKFTCRQCGKKSNWYGICMTCRDKKQRVDRIEGIIERLKVLGVPEEALKPVIEYMEREKKKFVSPQRHGEHRAEKREKEGSG